VVSGQQTEQAGKGHYSSASNGQELQQQGAVFATVNRWCRSQRACRTREQLLLQTLDAWEPLHHTDCC
jgi:hypothetical protein